MPPTTTYCGYWSQLNTPFTETETERLAEAEQAFSGGIEVAEKHEVKTTLNLLLLNRAATQSMLRNYDGALADCERVVLDDPESSRALAQRGILLMFKSRYTDAVDSFAAAADKAGSNEWAIPHAYCCLRSGQLAQAVALMIPLWESSNVTDARVAAAELLLDAASQGAPSVPIDQIRAFLTVQAGTNPLATSVLA